MRAGPIIPIVPSGRPSATVGRRHHRDVGQVGQVRLGADEDADAGRAQRPLEQPHEQILLLERAQQELGALEVGLAREQVRLPVDQHVGRRVDRRAGTAACASRSARAVSSSCGRARSRSPSIRRARAWSSVSPLDQPVQVVVDAVEVARRQREVDRDQLVLDLAARRGDDRQQLARRAGARTPGARPRRCRAAAPARRPSGG